MQNYVYYTYYSCYTNGQYTGMYVFTWNRDCEVIIHCKVSQSPCDPACHRGCLTIMSCSCGYTAVKPISKLGLCIHSDRVCCGRSKTSECIEILRCCGDTLFGTTLCLVPHSIVVKSDRRCGGMMCPSDPKRLTSIWRDCDTSWNGT